MTDRQIEHLKSLRGNHDLEIMLADRTVESYAAEYADMPDLYWCICEDLNISLLERIK